jgi:hypothetical protein
MIRMVSADHGGPVDQLLLPTDTEAARSAAELFLAFFDDQARFGQLTGAKGLTCGPFDGPKGLS